MKQVIPFYRGSRPLEPTNHIVIVTLPNGGQVLRRVSLNIIQMRDAESRLMQLQHAGHIRGYIFTAANDCSQPELLEWFGSLAHVDQQAELISVAQNTLFAGGAL